MSEQALWVIGSVLVGLLAFVAGAKLVLERVAPRTETEVDDKILAALPVTNDIIRGLAAALGVEVKDTDSPEVARAKVVVATEEKKKAAQ